MPPAALEAARRVAKRRRGRWFDPSLVDAFLRFCGDRDFWGALESPDVSEWEPPDLALAGDDERLDRIAQAFARVIDAKSPFTARHSERVAEIADGIGAALGFDPIARRILLRAGLLHDIGKLAVSNHILDKPGKLTDEEFRAIKTHPVHTLRILERAPCFAELADLAANHHEKLDGSGYPRSLKPATSTSQCGFWRWPTSTRPSPPTARTVLPSLPRRHSGSSAGRRRRSWTPMPWAPSRRTSPGQCGPWWRFSTRRSSPG